MKAIQLRSPLNLSYVSTNTDFTSLELSIFINADVTAIDTTTTPDYFLLGEPIGLRLDFEIAELIRSKNNYTYKPDFYTTRDTATYVLVRAVLKDDSDAVISKQYNLIKVRDGYVERNEVQSLYSEISTNPTTWSNKFNTTIAADGDDPFGGTDAYSISDTNDVDAFVLRDVLQLTGVYTMSCFVIGAITIEIGKDENNEIAVDLATGDVTAVTGDVIAYDIFKVGLWYKISVTFTMALGDQFRIAEQIPAGAAAIRLFSPTIMKGKLINFEPSEVLLQSNTTVFDFAGFGSVTNKLSRFSLDRKESVAYSVLTQLNIPINLRSDFIANPLKTSFTITTAVINSFFLISETKLFTKPFICETKHTPAKISFINKFGVIQDLVFFKKRVNTFSTSQQDFKANILRNGTYLPHTGQKQIISKTANAEVKLNTGFYPEDFNEVFKQLVYSTAYWIDDEPAILKNTNFVFKTSVNDKLIDYAFDFEYANPDINDIR
jgi:hypothetical protein